jgi:hypothetical protein
MISAPKIGFAQRIGGDGNGVTRRHLLAGSGACVVSGCTVPPVIGNAFNVARTLAGPPDVPISPEYVANLPYASMAAKIGKGPRSLVVLGRNEGSDMHWISADRAVIVTRNGRVKATFGIGMDLLDTQGLENDPVAAATFAFEGLHTRTVDLADPRKLYGTPIESTFEVVGRETIQILGQDKDTIQIEELNSATSIRWNFKNQFWFDFNSGFLWKSVQHFVRNVPPIETEILKPAK